MKQFTDSKKLIFTIIIIVTNDYKKQKEINYAFIINVTKERYVLSMIRVIEFVNVTIII